MGADWCFESIGDDMLLSKIGIKAQAQAKAVSPYQEWSAYPDSPVLTSEYPYQAIGKTYDNTTIRLLCSTGKQHYLFTDGFIHRLKGTDTYTSYTLSGDEWVAYGMDNIQLNRYGAIGDALANLLEANNDVYTDGTFATVWKAKTTP